VADITRCNFSIVAITNTTSPVKYFSPATSTFIIRVHREHFRLVWAAITLITRLPQPIRTPCVIQVIRNSGTIQLAEKEAIRRARDALRRAQCEGAEGSAQVLDFMVSEVQNSAGESDDEMDEG
jgi:ribonuclease P/MRP protein subunit POP5